jgi:phosphoribosylformylglycinamidine cyclo-ligase
VGNTKRILPDGLKLNIDWEAWQHPSIYKLIKEIGNVPEDDMRATFNLGIGLIAVVSKTNVDAIQAKAAELGEETVSLGSIQ